MRERASSPRVGTGFRPAVSVAIVAPGLIAIPIAAAGTLPPVDERLAVLEEGYRQLREENKYLRSRLDELAALPGPATESASDQALPRHTSPDARMAGQPTTPPTVVDSMPEGRLQVSGDLRLRYEANLGSETVAGRNREVLRARLGASYRLSDSLLVVGRVVTGDADDPNSADVTLSNFDDDLRISLDQAYVSFSRGNWLVSGGKLPNPFYRTELVWDGDVNPQGLSAQYSAPVNDATLLQARALYFVIDERAAASDSKMVGLQIGLSGHGQGAWTYALAAGFYDYTLSSLAGADVGDTRSNRLSQDGLHYLSDFDLIDVVGSLAFTPSAANWPGTITAHYVRNLGAVTSENSGFSLELTLGNTGEESDLRFMYGYAVAETDAALAAFSQDNTTLATNYEQHSLSIDYTLSPHVVVNGTWYHFRPYATGNHTASVDAGWLDRFRLNLVVGF